MVCDVCGREGARIRRLTRSYGKGATICVAEFEAEILRQAERAKAWAEQARRAAARSVNAIMTATYWEIGRRIVEHEQGGETRAGYGEQLLERLADDLTKRVGRGFSIRNLRSFRAFYLSWQIRQTVSAESEKVHILSTQFDLTEIAHSFPLSWSHYVKLLAIRDAKAREFYAAEALRGGWTVRQLDRQIGSQFYRRTLLSRNKAAMLTKGAHLRPEKAITPEKEMNQ